MSCIVLLRLQEVRPKRESDELRPLRNALITLDSTLTGRGEICAQVEPKGPFRIRFLCLESQRGSRASRLKVTDTDDSAGADPSALQLRLKLESAPGSGVGLSLEAQLEIRLGPGRADTTWTGFPNLGTGSI